MTAVRVPRPVARPARRLLCFPWAGASASVYRSWAAALPPGVELVAAQYPGREDRAREPFATDLEALADEVVEDLFDHVADVGEAPEDTPLTLFGHSAGASVALATARLLERDAPGAVRGLVVSGRRAPGTAPGAVRSLVERDAATRDEAMLASLRAALSAARADPAAGAADLPELSDELLRDVLVPTLRADLDMLAGYDPRPGEPVTVDLAAYTGAADPAVPAAELEAWAAMTTGRFSRLVFPGDHFYLVPERSRVLSALVAHMSS